VPGVDGIGLDLEVRVHEHAVLPLCHTSFLNWHTPYLAAPRARLSPFKLTQQLADEEVERLYEATWSALQVWIERLRRDVGEWFPEKVTAFRPEMAVHGRYRQPCAVGAAPIQRIFYA
jgi:hypothetical protein